MFSLHFQVFCWTDSSELVLSNRRLPNVTTQPLKSYSR